MSCSYLFTFSIKFKTTTCYLSIHLSTARGLFRAKVFPFFFIIIIYISLSSHGFPWVWQVYVNSNPVSSGPCYFQVGLSYSFKLDQATLSHWFKLLYYYNPFQSLLLTQGMARTSSYLRVYLPVPPWTWVTGHASSIGRLHRRVGWGHGCDTVSQLSRSVTFSPTDLILTPCQSRERGLAGSIPTVGGYSDYTQCSFPLRWASLDVDRGYPSLWCRRVIRTCRSLFNNNSHHHHHPLFKMFLLSSWRVLPRGN